MKLSAWGVRRKENEVCSKNGYTALIVFSHQMRLQRLGFQDSIGALTVAWCTAPGCPVGIFIAFSVCAAAGSFAEFRMPQPSVLPLLFKQKSQPDC